MQERNVHYFPFFFPPKNGCNCPADLPDRSPWHHGLWGGSNSKRPVQLVFRQPKSDLETEISSYRLFGGKIRGSTIHFFFQVAPKGAGSGGAGEPHVAICIAEWKGQPARCQESWEGEFDFSLIASIKMGWFSEKASHKNGGAWFCTPKIWRHFSLDNCQRTNAQTLPVLTPRSTGWTNPRESFGPKLGVRCHRCDSWSSYQSFPFLGVNTCIKNLCVFKKQFVERCWTIAIREDSCKQTDFELRPFLMDIRLGHSHQKLLQGADCLETWLFSSGSNQAIAAQVTMAWNNTGTAVLVKAATEADASMVATPLPETPAGSSSSSLFLLLMS